MNTPASSPGPQSPVPNPPSPAPNPPGLFITGTSTEVGKTYVAAMIARALAGAGRRVGVYKPAASGCRREAGALVADDATLLWEAAGRPGDLEDVCPQRFLAPLAPDRAARAEGRRVDSALLRTGVDRWRQTSDVVLVEGAGGLMSPLADDAYNIDLAADLGYPLVIVAANVLGVINAALQTLITAQTRAPRLPIAGIVLNQPAIRSDDASQAYNAEDLAARSPAPLLATVAHGATDVTPRVDWFQLASS
ncbi:MAG TPA: dethiobiotin synthase [Lacipirellulaceae bacterium]|nr:dethiobiotin synthase [Lacipirellulaceae bacterium]